MRWEVTSVNGIPQPFQRLVSRTAAETSRAPLSPRGTCICHRCRWSRGRSCRRWAEASRTVRTSFDGNLSLITNKMRGHPGQVGAHRRSANYISGWNKLASRPPSVCVPHIPKTRVCTMEYSFTLQRRSRWGQNRDVVYACPRTQIFTLVLSGYIYIYSYSIIDEISSLYSGFSIPCNSSGLQQKQLVTCY